MSKTSRLDPSIVPPVDVAGIAALTRLAEAAAREETTSSGSSGPLIGFRQAAGADGPEVRGEPGAVYCPDCGAALEKVLEPAGSWLSLWVKPEHTCEAREGRLRREGEAAAAARRAWLREPPASRIAEVRQRCRLPHWTPAGTARIVPMQGWQPGAAVTAAKEHADLWRQAQRPERGLWLWSAETNLRKTATVAALAFDVAHEVGSPCLFWNFEDLMEKLRQAAGGRSNDYDPERIAAAELLVLDDIGTVKYTEKAWETLFAMVNAATDAWGASGPRQTLYVTSNESPGELQVILDRAVQNGGKRIVRRLVQACEVIEA